MAMEHVEQIATGSADEKTEGGAKTPTEKLVKVPGEVTGLSGTIIWAYMLNKHALTSDQLSKLQVAMIPAKVQGKRGTVVRVFEPKSCEAKGLNVNNFDSMNMHPQLILYDGYFYEHGGQDDIVIEKRKATGPSLLEQKLQEGSITEIGMKVADSTTMKWLKGFGKFLMMGGFLVIVALAVVIAIAVSVLTK